MNSRCYRMCHVNALHLIAVCALLATWVEQPAHAQDAPPHPRYPRTLEEGEPPIVSGALTEAPAAPPPLESAQGDGGRIAYQSYQDGNWEVYIGDSAAYSPGQRLTADPASDIEPELNAQMTQVVFTSRRTGNYDIFRINSDGGGLTQLTAHSATDSSPAWSPDGRRIVFQSNRNGNYDIFVMNADGGGQTQLTANADYDGEPAWSPDGTQIAFISKRTPGDVDYFLYVMNADGSGQHLLSPVPNSGRPAWSWDGQRILIDGLVSTGWQRLFVVEASTGSTQQLISGTNNPSADILSGSWGINSRIFYTFVAYEQANGQWYWRTMSILSEDSGSAWPDTVRSDRMGFPSWANLDRLPPVTYVAPPPSPYWRATAPFRVLASVIDAGGAGLGMTEVQTRQPGQDWQHRVYCENVGPTTVACPFNPATNGTLEYRLRSRDAYGNVEAWPEDPARWGQLKSFLRLSVGSVRDLRGTGLVNVPVGGVSTYEPATVTDLAGNWVAPNNFLYETFTATVSVDGLTVSRGMADMQVLDNGDLRANLVITPTDNVLVNSGFDAGTAAWQPTPGATFTWLPPYQTQIGSAVLRLSWAGPGAMVLDTASTATAVVSGTLTLIAHRNETGNVLSLCPPVGPCADEPLGPTENRDLAVRADGTLAVVVDNGNGTRSFLQRSPAGVWSGPEDFPFMGAGIGHRLLADSTGRWHAVWAEGDGMVHIAHRFDDGTWSGAAQAGLMQKGVDAVIDASDVIHMVGCPTTGVIEVTWSEAVGMSLPTTVSNETCDTPHFGTTIDGLGHIDTVWSTGGVARFSRRAANGTWSAPVPATGTTLLARRSGLGPQGRPTVLGSNPQDGLYLLQLAADGASWDRLAQSVPPLLAASGREILAFNWSGQHKLVVSEALANGYLYNNHVTVYDFDADRTRIAVTQRVSLPIGLHRPVLSAQYRFTPLDANDTLALSVQGPGDGAPTYFPLPSGPDWQIGSADLTAWAGQSVAVALVVLDGGSATNPTVDVNEMTLGSWYTPRPTTISPETLPAGGGTIVITGDNFTSPGVTVAGQSLAVTVIDPQHLSVVVPGSLPAGRWPVLVTNRGAWTVAAPAALQVGSVLLMPSLLRWAPPMAP